MPRRSVIFRESAMVNVNDAERQVGSVTRLFREKGFGFITDRESGREIFFHKAETSPQTWEYIDVGHYVTYLIQQTPKGLRAVDVVFEAREGRSYPPKVNR